jgi:hypothetical protein
VILDPRPVRPSSEIEKEKQGNGGQLRAARIFIYIYPTRRIGARRSPRRDQAALCLDRYPFLKERLRLPEREIKSSGQADFAAARAAFRRMVKSFPAATMFFGRRDATLQLPFLRLETFRAADVAIVAVSAMGRFKKLS